MIPLLRQYLQMPDLAPPLPSGESEPFAGSILIPAANLDAYPNSITATERSVLFLGLREGKKYLGVISGDPTVGRRFQGDTHRFTMDGIDLAVTVAPAGGRNASVLRELLPFLRPRTLGLAKSIGCGDRLGMATPGHVRAVRKTTVVPILAQQSVRENERTGRCPQKVLDDATWGAFQEGWRGGFGADADHLKTESDVRAFAEAGYSFYTIDPGAHVDNEAGHAAGDMLRRKVEAVPWDELETGRADLTRALAGKPLDLADYTARLTEEEILRAAAKYARVVVHTVQMYRGIAEKMNGRPFELEVSVDETETVTTLAEHIYIAHELRRMGVKWVSLAPRYVGDFEKGIDYIGDLAEFEKSFARHAGVAKAFGPYKLSLHSGSDKFSVYPIIGKLAGDLCHVKTAGTSYLEALRTISRADPKLFRRIVDVAMGRYPADRATYHVSAEVSKMPDVLTISDEGLIGLLDDFNAREVLHVTYGSVIHHPDLRGPFFKTLRQHEQDYSAVLEAHFDKHLHPFA